MLDNYFDAISSIISLMKQPDSPCKNVRWHRTCYSLLSKYLMENNIEFSMDAALEWLEKKKGNVGQQTISSYRNALFRLEHYLLFGNINSPFCRSEETFFCRSNISESFYRLLYEMKEDVDVENPSYYQGYSVAFKTFFQIATAMGITEAKEITADALIVYRNECCTASESKRKRRAATSAMSALMRYLNKRGDVPACYAVLLLECHADQLCKLKIKNPGDAVHPSLELEPYVEEFISTLSEWQYLESTKKLVRNALKWYFMFLEINHLNHSGEAVDLFYRMQPEYPSAKKKNSTSSSFRIHAVKMFVEFINNNLTTNLLVKNKSNMFDIIPEWCQPILAGFLNARKQDGVAKSTIDMCRAASGKFFLYLDRNGIHSCKEITPYIVSGYHNQDFHSTGESKNAYNIKLRQLLRYMAEQGLVSESLEYAVPTTYAPHRNIVDVLSDDMVEKIYEYRKQASTSLELRNIAIVMLGLRMGMRGIDIINLKVTDFDWANKTASFVQQKTGVAITLPVPNDVGNCVYQYIVNGRPKASQDANGYIFVRHVAPYIPFKDTNVCKFSLQRILETYNYELTKGQGFHMTRKTFATNMLRANNRLDDISNALGHTNPSTAEVYLERDENDMRLCPLNFGGIWS